MTAGLLAIGAVVLAGGGAEEPGGWSDEPYAVLAAAGDVVILGHDPPADDWLANYFLSLGATSATDLTITGDDPAIAAQIEAADAVFIRGGDQWLYVRDWAGTSVAAAIQAVSDRGGPVGGTSAGAMVLGEHDYDARNGTVYPEEMLADTGNMYATVSSDLLPLVGGALVDTHFGQRARLGRLLPLLACTAPDARVAIGVDDATAAIVEGTTLRAAGGGSVTVIWQPGEARCGALPHAGPFPMVMLTDGMSIDLETGAPSQQVIAEAASSVDLRGDPTDTADVEQWPWAATADGSTFTPETLGAAVGATTIVPWGEPLTDDNVAVSSTTGIPPCEGCGGHRTLLLGEAASAAGTRRIANPADPDAIWCGTLEVEEAWGLIEAVVVTDAWHPDEGEARVVGALAAGHHLTIILGRGRLTGGGAPYDGGGTESAVLVETGPGWTYGTAIMPGCAAPRVAPANLRMTAWVASDVVPVVSNEPEPPDAGMSAETEGAGGCGCSTSPGAPSPLMLLLLALLLRTGTRRSA